MFPNDGADAAQVGLIKCALLDGAQQTQSVVSGFALRHSDRAFELDGLGSWPLGIRKHVEVGDGKLLQKPVGVEKVLFGFAGEAHNHVNPNGCVGHAVDDARHALGVKFAAVAALH